MSKRKLIAVTLRCTDVQDVGEGRDSLDRRWYDLFEKASLMPILLPNNLKLTKELVQRVQLDGILLTGGGDLACYDAENGDDAREKVEKFLIEKSINQRLPLLGVCRGMQKIQEYFGTPFTKIEGHVAQTQEILIDDVPATVNSFHDYGAVAPGEGLLVWAKAHDDIIKAVRHPDLPIEGIMWHPERMDPFREGDVAYFKNFYGV